jgi:hypothetical protein
MPQPAVTPSSCRVDVSKAAAAAAELAAAAVPTAALQHPTKAASANGKLAEQLQQQGGGFSALGVLLTYCISKFSTLSPKPNVYCQQDDNAEVLLLLLCCAAVVQQLYICLCALCEVCSAFAWLSSRSLGSAPLA